MIEIALQKYRRNRSNHLWRLAVRFWTAGQQMEAMAAAEKAAKLAPERLSFHIGLAEFHLASGDPKGAASRLKSAAEMYSTAHRRPGDERTVVKMAGALQKI